MLSVLLRNAVKRIASLSRFRHSKCMERSTIMRHVVIRRLGKIALATTALLGCFGNGSAQAGVISGPTAIDQFTSDFSEYLILKKSYFTSLPSDVTVNAHGTDFNGTKANVIRELNAHVGFYGTDTIDTEFLSMHLAGIASLGSIGVPVQFKIGAGTGFRPGLTRSPGQVAEVTGTPTDGTLDKMPADSVFDLFIDVWVDLNFDDVVDNGEVLRNFDDSLRMYEQLSSFPPTPNVDVYVSVGKVSILDPLLGEFGATVSTGLIDFYMVNPDGTNSGVLAAQLDPNLLNKHVPTPEPSSLAIFGGLAFFAARRKWKQRRAASSMS